MVWLMVLALAAWVYAERRQVRSLGAEVSRLAREVARLSAEAAPLAEPEPVRPAPQPLVELAPVPRAPPPPSRPVFAAEPEPAPPGPVEARSEPRPGPGRSASTWLAENGLAWIGGGALALGGLLLVAYAAERGVFTPALRIAAAVAAGIVMLGAGEWVRRGGLKRGEGGPVAALAAGAGAATLYAAIWAAQALYGFIPVAPAAMLMGGVSLGLLGLALLHGEPLALLAVAGAYAVPWVSGAGRWEAGALDAYPALIATTGFAAAGLRRWVRSGLAALAGAAAWALEGVAAGDPVRAGLL